MRLLRQLPKQRTPLLNPIALHAQQTDVRRRPQKALLQVLPEPIVNRERHDQRSHPRRNPGDRNPRDYANDGLPPFRSQISGSNEEFKAHEE
jgi:hypothetical protein